MKHRGSQFPRVLVFVCAFAFPSLMTAQGNNPGTGLTQQLAALEARVTSTEARLTAAEADLSAVRTRLDSAEGRLTAAEALMSALTADNATQAGQIAAAAARLNTAEAALTTLATQSANQAGQIAALQAEKVPVGTIIAYSAEVPPAGYLECDGRELLRADYPGLFAVVGTTFGKGDGVSTFRIPQLRGLFMRGWDHGNGFDPDRASRVAMFSGGASGDHVGSFQDFQVQAHSHIVFSSSFNAFGIFQGIVGANASGSLLNVSSSSGGNETRPRNMSMLYAIKY